MTLIARIIVGAPTLLPSASNTSAAKPIHLLRRRPPSYPRLFAMDLLDKNPQCLDILVTQDGTKNGIVAGWDHQCNGAKCGNHLRTSETGRCRTKTVLMPLLEQEDQQVNPVAMINYPS